MVAQNDLQYVLCIDLQNTNSCLVQSVDTQKILQKMKVKGGRSCQVTVLPFFFIPLNFENSKVKNLKTFKNFKTCENLNFVTFFTKLKFKLFFLSCFVRYILKHTCNYMKKVEWNLLKPINHSIIWWGKGKREWLDVTQSFTKSNKK